MIRKQKLSTEDYEKIIHNRGEGLDNQESADMIGISSSSVGYTLRAYDAVRRKDWKQVKQMIRGTMSLNLFEWCADRCGVDLDKSVYEIYASRTGGNKPAYNPSTEMEATSRKNEEVFFTRLLEMQMQQAELLQNILKKLEDMQAVTNTFYLKYIPDQYIPEITKTFADTFNANADVINATLMDIRQNTRRR